MKMSISDGDTIRYSYDSKGRVVKIENSRFGPAVYVYSDTAIVCNNYDLKDSLEYVQVYKLDANGRAISMKETDDPYQDNSFSYTTGGQLSTYTNVNKEPGMPQDTWTENYSYRNGNLDSIVRTDRKGNMVNSTVDYYDEFYMDRVNTIGNDNMGLGWKGSSSKNPVKMVRIGGNAGSHVASTYQYTFDSLGRIISQREIQTGINFPAVNFIYY